MSVAERVRPASEATAAVPVAPGLLQRSCACGGGAGVSGLCGSCQSEERFGAHPLQAKFTVSSPGDPFEVEADRAADAVMNGAPPPRMSIGAARGASAPHATERLDREAEPAREDDEEDAVQAKAAVPAPPGPGFAAGLAGAGGGAPLPPTARTFFERGLGHDFGHVRVHDGSAAAGLARSIHARAFTHGHDIYFGAGAFDPASSEGKRLLAHELAHTVQQGGGVLQRKALDGAPARPPPMVRLPMDGPANPNEIAAERTAAAPEAAGGVPPPGDGAAASDDAAELPAALAADILVPRGGEPLSPGLRAAAETRLGGDFGHVRVHHGPRAAMLADWLDARAFTWGEHIWLGESEWGGDRPLMLHELTHVQQQAPRVPRRVQATKRWYYALPNLGPGSLGPGERLHDLVLPVIGGTTGNSGLFTEVPIPGGAFSGSGATGRADLVKSSTGALPAVRFDGADPAFQNIVGKSKTTKKRGTTLDGADFTESAHRKSAAPVANTTQNGAKACAGAGLPDGKGICRVDQGPTLMIGDLKPNWEAATLLGGEQVDNYIAKTNDLAGKVNAFGAANKDLIKPAGASWSGSARRLKASELTLPDFFEAPTAATGRRVEAALFVNGDMTGIRETTVVHLAKAGDGIITWELCPVSGLGTGAVVPPAAPATGGIASVKADLVPVQNELKQEPEHKIGKAPRRRGRVGARGARRVARAPAGREKIVAKDNFNLGDWQRTHYSPWRTKAEKATGGAGGQALRSPSDEAKARMKNEALRQIRERTSMKGLKTPPTDTEAKTRELDRVQHWIDRGLLYGQLRRFLGTTYIKLANAYDNLKQRIEAKIDSARKRMSKATGGAGGIKGAVLGALRKIAGSLLGVFVRDVGHRLMTAVKKGATVLIGKLFGDEVAEVEAKLKEIEQAEADFKKFIAEALEAKFKAQLERFETVVREIESIVGTMKTIGTIVNTVKWAYRIAQCLAPPALGCLLGLVGSAIAEAILAAIIASCWFQREVAYPIMNTLGPIRTLPATVAKGIADVVRGLLPDSIKPLIAEIDTSDLDSKPDDVDCDSDSANKYNNLTPEQRQLAELLKQYDPDHVDALMKALKHLGLIKDPPDAADKLTSDKIGQLKKLLDTYSKAKLDELMAKAPQRPFRAGGIDQAVPDLEKAAKDQGIAPGDTTAETAAPGDGGTGDAPSAADLVAEGKQVAAQLAKVTVLPPVGEGWFSLPRTKDGQLARPDGQPVVAGDSVTVFRTVRVSAQVTIAGFQRITIQSLKEGGGVMIIHGGTNYFTIDGTFVETVTEQRDVEFTRAAGKAK